MNEHDLTRHLSAHAAEVEPTADSDALLRSMVRLDRNRRIRAVGAGGSVAAIVAFGFLSIGGGNGATSGLEVRGQAPALVPADPDLGVGTVEQSVEGSGEQPYDERHDDSADGAPEVDPGLDPAPSSEPPSSEPPTHLREAPSTTGAPAVVATTVPPTPVPTAPPTTVPTTTVTTTTTPPTSTVVPAAFSASALYGSCELDPPYDEYSGIAAPGATITITSPYSSSAQTVADAAGTWYLKVEFPAAPVDSPFTVTAGDGSSSVEMSFVRVG